MFNYISSSETETKNVGIKLGKLLSAGDIICLFGNLGTGKTILASGIAAGIGIQGSITSPTFTIVNEYSGRLPFFHFDVYRITSEEFLGMGGDEYFYSGGIVLIEWSENIYDILPEEHLEIYIDYHSSLHGNDERKISFKPNCQKYIEILKKLLEVLK